MTFNARPLQDAEAFLEHGDYARGCGKLCEAVNLAVKAATGEWAADSPRETRRLVERLFRETGDRELLRLYSVVESLRANATDDFMSGEAVKACAEDVRTLVQKLYALPGSGAAKVASPAAGTDPEAAAAVRRAAFSRRLAGLTRRESRKQVIEELARVEGQLQNLMPLAVEARIPGLPEARIARAMSRPEGQSGSDPASQELALYKQWLLEIMVNSRKQF